MSFASGRRLSAAQLERIANPPRAALRQDTFQTLTTLTWTSLTLDFEEWDVPTPGGHSTTVNASRYTSQIDGLFHVVGKASFVANSNGARGCRIAKNGTARPMSEVVLPSSANMSTFNFAVSSFPVLVELSVGDYVEVQGWQNTGSNLNTAVSSDGTKSGMMLYLVRDNSL